MNKDELDKIMALLRDPASRREMGIYLMRVAYLRAGIDLTYRHASMAYDAKNNSATARGDVPTGR